MNETRAIAVLQGREPADDDTIRAAWNYLVARRIVWKTEWKFSARVTELREAKVLVLPALDLGGCK